MCSRCHKRPAVVFISSTNVNDPNKAMKNQGLCLTCARELNIPQVEDYIKQMGISEDELQAMSDTMMDLAEGDSFEPGGSGTMPNFLRNLFSFKNIK